MHERAFFDRHVSSVHVHWVHVTTSKQGVTLAGHAFCLKRELCSLFYSTEVWGHATPRRQDIPKPCCLYYIHAADWSQVSLWCGRYGKYPHCRQSQSDKAWRGKIIHIIESCVYVNVDSMRDKSCDVQCHVYPMRVFDCYNDRQYYEDTRIRQFRMQTMVSGD